MDTPNSDRTSKNPVPISLLLDAAGVAALLFVSKATVWRLRDSGKLPLPVKVGSLTRWRRVDIEEWLAVRCPAVVASAQRR